MCIWRLYPWSCTDLRWCCAEWGLKILRVLAKICRMIIKIVCRPKWSATGDKIFWTWSFRISLHALADLGGVPGARPPKVQILSFWHTNFLKRKHLGSPPHYETSTSPPTGIPGSATDMYINLHFNPQDFTTCLVHF